MIFSCRSLVFGVVASLWAVCCLGQTVPQVELSPGGPQVSRIGAGCLHLGQKGINTGEAVLEWMQTFLKYGVTLFDTADVYPVKGGTSGDAVKLMGDAFLLDTSLRAQVQVQAKLDIASFAPAYLNTSVAYINERVQWYLDNLHTDYLDILLLHYADTLMDADAVAAAMNSLKTSGKVHHFGVSNHFPHHFKLLQSRLDDYGIKLVTNEVEISVWNPSYLDYNSAVVDDLYTNKIRPIAWSSLGGDPLGGLNRLFQKPGTRQLKLRRSLESVGDALGGYEADVVALGWVLRHPSGIIPLIGSTNPDRIAHQLTAIDMYSMITESQWWDIGGKGGLCAFGDSQCNYDEYK